MGSEKVLTINSGAITEKAISTAGALELEFFVADGTEDPIPINPDDTLPFTKANGVQSNIPLGPFNLAGLDMIQVQVFT